MKKVLKHVNNQRGVTLLELLAVVIILGVIAAVAVPAVLGHINDSKVEVDNTNMAIISDAFERALMKEVFDPTALTMPLTVDPNADGSTTPYVQDAANTAVTGIIPDYLKEVPAIQDSTMSTYSVNIDTANNNTITVTLAP